MTLHENLQQRAALHARLGARQIPHGGGDVPNPLDPDDPTPPPSTTTRRTPTPTPDPDDKVTTTSRTTRTTSSATSSTTSSSSSSSTSSTSSTTSTSTTATVTPRTTSSITATPSTSIKVVTSSRAFTSAASAETSAAPTTSSSSTGAIVGGIGGGILGAIVIAMIAAFIVRRMRRKRDNRALNFDPDNFRRSAVLLDDSDATMPSMAERKPAAAAPHQYSDVPQEPSSAYGSSEARYNNYGSASQYGAAPGAIYNPHAASGGYGGQYEQPGYGAPPMPGQYGPGAYAGYGAGAAAAGPIGGYQSRQQYQQEYSSSSPYQQVQQHIGGYGAAGAYGPNGARSATTSPPSSEHHGTSPSPNPISRSISNATSSATAPLSEVSRGPTQALSRQPTLSGEAAPPAYHDNAGKYTELKRDEKIKPAEMNVQNGSVQAGEASATKQRPTSAYTVYDPEDAYGGM